MLIVFKHKSFSPWSKNHCADTLAILFTWRCCLGKNILAEALSMLILMSWCWDVWYITLCNWKMGSLYVGLQAEIMTSPWKRGLGHNEGAKWDSRSEPLQDLKEARSLVKTHSVANRMLLPHTPTYSSSTKHKQARDRPDSWADDQLSFGLEWTTMEMYQFAPFPLWPVVYCYAVQTLLMESRVVCRRERPCGFNAFSSTYCIHGGSAHLFFRHQCFVNDGQCNLLLPLR